MSKEYPSLTEEEYAGFMGNMKRLDEWDEKRKQKKAALATGDAKNNKSAPKRTIPSKVSGDGQTKSKKVVAAATKNEKAKEDEIEKISQKRFLLSQKNVWIKLVKKIFP